AVEQAGIFPAIVEFEGALQQLGADPVDPSLRAAAVATAETLANKFNIAANSLDSVAEGAQFEARAAVDQANILAAELARVNVRLARAGAGSSDRASLLDQRDLMLEKLSGIASIATTFGPDGGVSVPVGGSTGPVLVTGNTASSIAMTIGGDGTRSFDSGDTDVALNGGSLAGRALALKEVAEVRTQMDSLAETIATMANTAQTNGVALDGLPGQPLFNGTTAGTIRAAFSDGSMLAT